MKNLLFVDDEPKVLQGLERQLYSMRQEWKMDFVDAGPKALTFMEAHSVDVIVSDMVMPEMDGAQLLGEVARRHPNTVRIVLSGHTDRESVLRLVGSAHQYIAKPCEATELRDAIARAFTLRDLLCNEKLKELATRLKCLPALPTMYQKLAAEFQKDDPAIENICEIIARDPAIATKILQLVNSAFFGLPQPVDNLSDAIMYLGLTTVRSLVLHLQTFSQIGGKSIPGFSVDALARHSWMAGVAARRIAATERKDIKTCDQCFLAGLLHDIGRLILATGLPDEYTEVLKQSKTKIVPLYVAEKDYFGATHAEVGAYLLGLWGLPNPIIEAVALHHQPSASMARSFSPVIAVHTADVFLHEDAEPEGELPPPVLDVAHLSLIKLYDRVPEWRIAGLGSDDF